MTRILSGHPILTVCIGAALVCGIGAMVWDWVAGEPTITLIIR